MQTIYNGIPVPTAGEAIQYADGKYTVPDRPIIPFIQIVSQILHTINSVPKP